MPDKIWTIPREVKINHSTLRLESVNIDFDGNKTIVYKSVFAYPSILELTFDTPEQFNEQLATAGGEVV